MRRLVIEAIAYLRDLGHATLRGWVSFFFSPADPTALGLIRVAVGLLAFWSLLVFGLDLQDYFGSTGWAEQGRDPLIRGAARVVILVPGARRLVAAGMVSLPGDSHAFCFGAI